MAYRGRGRGQGLAKQVSFELLPEVENLVNASCVTERITLAIWQANLQKAMTSLASAERTLKLSALYSTLSDTCILCMLQYEQIVVSKTKGMYIERFSDRSLERDKSKPPLTHSIRMDSAHVPAELAKGGTEERHAAKRVRWNPESDMQKLDLLEKLDQKSKGDDEKKKDGEDEDEEQEEKTADEEEEFSDDGDYNQNLYDYDDDEDDYNMNEDNNDDAMY